MTELIDWVLGDWHESTDWMLTEWEIEWLQPLVMQDTLRFDYNQWKQSWSKKSCSIFQAIWNLSDLMNYEFWLDEIKEIDDMSYQRWRAKNSWWYTKDAVKLVCDWWNAKFPDRPVAYYSVLFADDNKCNAIMEKNYNLSVSFNYTKEYAEDILDWVVDNAKKWTKLTGHCVNEIIKLWKKMIKDNYAWSTHQYYKLKPTNEELYNAWIFHTRAYYIVKVWESNLSELKRFEKVKTAALNALEANSALRHETNSQEVKDKLHETNETIRNVILKYIESMTTKLRNDL